MLHAVRELPRRQREDFAVQRLGRRVVGAVEEAFEQTAFEDFVTEQVRGGRSILGLYPATDPQTMTDFADWRKRNGR